MSTPRTIRRKPAPLFDERYPSPDPTDPFAPLWVLRSRSSNPALSLTSGTYELNALPPVERLKGTQHRRRSQSTPPTQVLSPVAFPSIQSTPQIYARPTPSLFTDNTSDSGSGSGTDVEPSSRDHKAEPFPSRPSTPIRLARFLLPKKTRNSFAALENPFRVRALSVKHVAKQSISPPVEIKQLDPPLDTLSLRTPPEPPSLTPPPRSFVTSQVPSPSRELDSTHDITSTPPPIPAPPPPSRTHSFASSYVHISNPSISTCYSTPDDFHTYTSPRPAPHPARPSTSTSTPIPFLQGGHTCRPQKQHHQRHRHRRTRTTGPPPPLLLPTQTEWSTPTPSQLAYAASLPLIAESGVRVSFGSLFAAQRTIVVFIRHFWCPLCQDYMTSLMELAHPDMMWAAEREKAGEGGREKEREKVQLIVISNGSHSFINKYRQLFGMPFNMYSDPSLALYVALGMGRDGDRPESILDDAGEGEGERVLLDGGYVTHGLVGGIAMVVLRAVKIGMPVWDKGGDINQLGGEFVFGPGLTCTFAHRMQATKGHVPVRDVLEAAGIDVGPLPTAIVSPDPVVVSATESYVSAVYGWEFGSGGKQRLKRGISMKEFGAPSSWRRRSVDGGAMTEGAAASRRRLSFTRMQTQMTHEEEEEEWMKERMRSLERLRERKRFRRGGAFFGYGLASATTATVGKELEVCSPVAETEEEVMMVGEVLVIGFEGGERAEGEGERENDDEISPTGATEDCDVQSEVGGRPKPLVG